jgi:hypothetical protein
MIQIIFLVQLITIIESDDKKPPQIIVIVIDDLGKENQKWGIKSKDQIFIQVGMMYLGTILTIWLSTWESMPGI